MSITPVIALINGHLISGKESNQLTADKTYLPLPLRPLSMQDYRTTIVGSPANSHISKNGNQNAQFSLGPLDIAALTPGDEVLKTHVLIQLYSKYVSYITRKALNH